MKKSTLVGIALMPREFHKLGISFQYPDNWALDEQDSAEEEPSVTVFSPGGAFWAVSVHPPTAESDRLAKTAVEALQAEYEGVEVERVQEEIEGHALTGFDLNFFFMELTNTATVRCLRGPAAVYTLFCQAEDREYEKVRAVFQAMTVSLLRGSLGS
jgi:hypothetical protein